MSPQTIFGLDNVSIEIEVTAADVCFACHFPAIIEGAQNISFVFATRREIGSAILPFARDAEGSTVFLPFNADLLLVIEIREGDATGFVRRWNDWRWSARACIPCAG